ncbi:hypothetical protein JMJ77_0005669 [Colletotrichum scovillei]|uniref:Uncharacterized protein n=1 Tax=Colletotrichum scovillei TaxID=1209932 RepID=A0A9P7RJT0_9PEZI|nr:hypothetical protein JMJ77_0005669 [Colletotrichum scovillei]KAG7083811.1 hypothetical protein JMJ78_0009253 [Colletotrichum scovillei]
MPAIDRLHGPHSLTAAARKLNWPVVELPQPPFSCNRPSRLLVSRVLRPAPAAEALRKSAIDHFATSHTNTGDPILGLLHRGPPPLDCLSATAAQLMQVDGRTCKTRLAGGFAFSREAYDVAKAKYPTCGPAYLTDPARSARVGLQTIDGSQQSDSPFPLDPSESHRDAAPSQFCAPTRLWHSATGEVGAIHNHQPPVLGSSQLASYCQWFQTKAIKPDEPVGAHGRELPCNAPGCRDD